MVFFACRLPKGGHRYIHHLKNIVDFRFGIGRGHYRHAGVWARGGDFSAAPMFFYEVGTTDSRKPFDFFILRIAWPKLCSKKIQVSKHLWSVELVNKLVIIVTLPITYRYVTHSFCPLL